MMLVQLVSAYHLHPIVDHFTIALLTFGVAAEILAAVLLLRPDLPVSSVWSQKLRSTSLFLMIGGGLASVLSYFTGDAEADRLWDTMSPAARQILASSSGASGYLSHAILGQYLMYVFLILATWRLMLELSERFETTRIAFLVAGLFAISALLYQGKTGGDLVYENGVGIAHRSDNSRHIPEPQNEQSSNVSLEH